MAVTTSKCVFQTFFQCSLVFFEYQQLYHRGGSRIFFRRGRTRLLLYFNTNKPHSLFFLQNTVVLENRRSFQGGVRTPCTLPLDPPLYQLSVARNATQQLFVESRLISISLVKQWLQRDTQRPNVSKYSEVPQMFFSMLSNYSCSVNLELPWKLLIYLFCSLRGTMVVSKVLCGFFRLVQNCHLPSDGSGRKFEDKSHAVAIRSLENSRERNFQETVFFFF